MDSHPKFKILIPLLKHSAFANEILLLLDVTIYVLIWFWQDKAEPNKLIGAKVKDNLTGEVWDIHAKIIVNATGPYVGTYNSI